MRLLTIVSADIPTTSAIDNDVSDDITTVVSENTEVQQSVASRGGIVSKVVDWFTSLRARGSDNSAEVVAEELFVQTTADNATVSEERTGEAQLESTNGMQAELVITIPTTFSGGYSISI